MKRLLKGEAYRPTGYGITINTHLYFSVFCEIWEKIFSGSALFPLCPFLSFKNYV
ncbi:MAG: hypothetical protein LBJ00_13765 [Planctomycetaceae bacterium]|nr:hypothetical protein [Planctomycetaceae bacterium]